MDNHFLEEYYENYDEEGRLLCQHGQVEYLTTMKYIHEFVPAGKKILEVGAGTGRYSIALSREGYCVNAVELVESNVRRFREKLVATDTVTVEQGNALCLSAFPDESFDAVLVLGPLYHLCTKEEQITALREAKRVLRKDGCLITAYIMNEPVLIQWSFGGDGKNMLSDVAGNRVTEDFHCLTNPQELFVMMRTEEIDELNEICGLQRQKIVGTDLFTRYFTERIDAYSPEVFELYLKYHFTICERKDLIGASNHVIDITRKIES